MLRKKSRLFLNFSEVVESGDGTNNLFMLILITLVDFAFQILHKEAV